MHFRASNNPVTQTVYLDADWMRYDDVRTKFWEIGNENSCPLEYGWMIDTAIKKYIHVIINYNCL